MDKQAVLTQLWEKLKFDTSLFTNRFHDAVLRDSHRVFFTINGQTHAKLRASTLRKAKLEALRDHLIVQVDCNGMDNGARAGVFYGRP